MNFTCVVAIVDGSGQQWNEAYDKPQCTTLEQARQWAERTVANFNSGLRPGEKPRKLIDVIPSDMKSCSSPHSWEKVNLGTQGKGRLFFDNMRCKVCWITGKRYGLSSGVSRDRRYRAKGYESCSKSLELLRKIAAKPGPNRGLAFPGLVLKKENCDGVHQDQSSGGRFWRTGK